MSSCAPTILPQPTRWVRRKLGLARIQARVVDRSRATIGNPSNQPPGGLPMRRLLTSAMVACGVLALASPASAESYPDRPVHLIIGFAPGGTTDISARLIAQALSDLWGQQIVVDNRPGAGTAIAAGLTAQAAPDGYTLFQNSSSQVVVGLIQKQLSYDPIKDFTPISKVLATPN